jgi:hypothetical protein
MGFVLRAEGRQAGWYSGRAGPGWIDADRKEAFIYRGEIEAGARAAGFNRNSSLHGCKFIVEREG